VRSKRAQEARVKADALLQSDKFEKAIGMYLLRACYLLYCAFA